MKTYKKKKNVNKILISVIIVIVAAIAVFFALYNIGLKPVSSKSEPKKFTVESGEMRDTICCSLEDEGIIKSSTWAKLYVKLSGKSEFRAGNFILNKNMGTKNIINCLNDSKNAGQDVITITFPEGLWAKDFSAKISEDTGIPEEKILSKWNDKKYIEKLQKKYPFITDDVYNSEHVLLEGYLMPDTYSFPRDGITVESITEQILNNTAKVIAEDKEKIERSGESIHEILTMASMIQGESNTIEDMYLISGVFRNRKEQGMPYQSSPTVKYSMYDSELKDSWRKVEASSNVDSRYNTYKVEGLPPGPVCNPGKDAIDAALSPKKTDYLYFMADVAHDSKVYYAETLEEQERNIDKYLR